jgi:hypothetical protein
VLTAAVLLAAALAAGVTDAWSPCGFSMVETLAPQGYAGRLRTTLVACATFALGALLGGVVTFAGLALLGEALGANAPFAAAAVALAAALGEARNARIVPQVRRQVPESWRRVLPVPVAAGLYGVLLGLGFTTFILSFAVWALAGISVALGDPALGAVVGLGFGAGRALPVVARAPGNGGGLHATMAERPGILRAIRAVDAATLALAATALAAAPAPAAVRTVAAGYADMSVDGALSALHRPGGPGELRRPSGIEVRPGNHPAVGGGRAAWIEGGAIRLDDGTAIAAPGADALAISSAWVVWRSGQALNAAPLADPAAVRTVLAGNVGKPSLNGNLVVFEIDGRIEAIELATGVRTLLRQQGRAELRGPSINGYRLTYVKATYKRQQVMTGSITPRDPRRDRALYGTTPTARRDAGHERGRRRARGHINQPLWVRPPKGVHDTLTTTATAPDAVFVTRVRQRTGAPATAEILHIDL